MINYILQNPYSDETEMFETIKVNLEKTGKKIIKADLTFFDHTLDLRIGDIDPTTLFPFGTKQLVQYGLKNRWNIQWDTELNYSDLLILGEDFVNHDMVVDELQYLAPKGDKVFLKENNGFNNSKGKLISTYAWESIRAGYLNVESNFLPHQTPISPHTLFSYSSPKAVVNEWRLWFVGNCVVTASQYIEDQGLKYSNADGNTVVQNFAQRCVEKLSPNMDTFCLDVFEVLDREKNKTLLTVGEINCLHCSGWYEMSVEKLIKKIDEKFS